MGTGRRLKVGNSRFPPERSRFITHLQRPEPEAHSAILTSIMINLKILINFRTVLVSFCMTKTLHLLLQKINDQWKEKKMRCSQQTSKVWVQEALILLFPEKSLKFPKKIFTTKFPEEIFTNKFPQLKRPYGSFTTKFPERVFTTIFSTKKSWKIPWKKFPKKIFIAKFETPLPVLASLL